MSLLCVSCPSNETGPREDGGPLRLDSLHPRCRFPGTPAESDDDKGCGAGVDVTSLVQGPPSDNVPNWVRLGLRSRPSEAPGRDTLVGISEGRLSEFSDGVTGETQTARDRGLVPGQGPTGGPTEV